LIKFLELGGTQSCRKLRLFGVACLQRLEPFIHDQRIPQIVRIAEAYADGSVSSKGLRNAHGRSGTLVKKLDGLSPASSKIACILCHAAVGANWVSCSNQSFHTNETMNRFVPGGYHAAAAGYVSSCAASAMFYAIYEGIDAFEQNRRKTEGLATGAEWIWENEEKEQTSLLHDIFGNPFRPVAIDPDWLAWNHGTVPKLAQTIYDDRRFDLLPILADALQDAGCTNDEILQHCHSPGAHVRGCWVIDLLLGKT
jgi:hypothetical protein